jgi:hypothetical protein
MRYYALHYHMKDSYIKEVIENIFAGFSRKDKLGILYSDAQESYSNTDLECINIKDLDYKDTSFVSKEQLQKEAAKLKDRIKESIRVPCVLHCHNVNVFRNSCLGAALLKLAQDYEDKEFLMIVHIHDFAEERFSERLELMANCTGRPDPAFGVKLAYPVWKNIIYLVGNSTDKQLLNQMGIQKDRIFIFQSPIDIGYFQSKPEDKDILITSIEEYSRSKKYNFSRHRKIILNPALLKKKMNFAESILILRSLNFIDDSWQLLMPFLSDENEDKKFAKELIQYIKKRKMPIVIGFDENQKGKNKKGQGISPNKKDFYAISDLVLTTSPERLHISAFLEPWAAGKALIGRKNDKIVSCLEKKGLRLAHLYDRIMIEDNDFKDYVLQHQLNLIHGVDYGALIRLPELRKNLDFALSDKSRIINKNNSVILRNFSIESANEQLRKIIKQGFRTAAFKEKELDNSNIVEHFRKNSKKK